MYHTDNKNSNFYPRPPRGGRPQLSGNNREGMQFLSTPSARRATRLLVGAEIPGLISIHALREEGDSRGTTKRRNERYFYPRPPRGGRLKRGKMHPAPCKFLSTPSARRATRHCPRPRLVKVISIHALREEGDLVIQPFGQTLEDFYPRPPRGGRPAAETCRGAQSSISIHALCEEGDMCAMTFYPRFSDFYPRPPRGGRPTLLAAFDQLNEISIHALREEGD